MARKAPIAPNIKKNPKYIHGLPAAEFNRLSRDLEKEKRVSKMRGCALHAAAFCLPKAHEDALRTFAVSRTI